METKEYKPGQTVRVDVPLEVLFAVTVPYMEGEDTLYQILGWRDSDTKAQQLVVTPNLLDTLWMTPNLLDAFYVDYFDKLSTGFYILHGTVSTEWDPRMGEVIGEEQLKVRPANIEDLARHGYNVDAP